MTTKAKNKAAEKAPKKLKLHKETLKDLSAKGQVKGGGVRESQYTCQIVGCPS